MNNPNHTILHKKKELTLHCNWKMVRTEELHEMLSNSKKQSQFYSTLLKMNEDF